MTNNHFKIITPLYNVREWIPKLIKSIQLQNYENFECYLVDDISTDGSNEIIRELIKDDKRFTLIENTEKKFALKNIYDAISVSGDDPEDIIVTLDGDDWLATKKTLEILNNTYNEYGCFLTYGSYIEFPSKQKGKFCLEIPEQIVKTSSYRSNRWLSSHLRTFKRHLWNSIKLEDLKKDDEFFRMTWDMAFMFPMLETAGPLAVHIDKILYCYNRQNPLNDDKVDHTLQLQTESYIRAKDIYQQNFVESHILGPSGNMTGIGNQLFCVTTALGYAYDNDATPYFPQIRTDSLINIYKDTFYKNMNIGRSGAFSTGFYNEPSFSYDQIKPLKGNIKISGYFQSYKYFDDHRDKILKDLNIENIKDLLEKKYGNHSDYISLHVRRGDYLKLSDYHHNLDIEYYKSATKHFDENSKYLVFSNDIKWCKDNFLFLNNVEFCENKEDWEDMILMSLCGHNIIANSSFSWWGAWFNTNQDKKVIAPRKWFGPLYSNKDTKDLIPPDWIIIE